MRTLRIATEHLARVLRQARSSPDRSAECSVARNEMRYGTELILGPFRPEAAAGRSTFRVMLSDRLAAPRWLVPSCEGVLILGARTQRGRAVGFARQGDEIAPLDSLALVGPAMPVVSLRDNAIGAARRTLGQLHVGLIGAGRIGSVMARLLASAGSRQLTIIDPDKLDPHNLGEADPILTADDVGLAKADAITAKLPALYPWAQALSVVRSASTMSALYALRPCDLLVCAVDHDSARLAATCVASLFLKPIVDVASGISRSPPRCGFSVRLVLPDRCLFCFGGLPRDIEARSVLRSGETERAFHDRRSWSSERGGSLGSLNRCAAAVAVRMVEDLLAGRVRSSTWAQIEFDSRGRIGVEYPVIGRSACQICDALHSRGDAGLGRVPEVLHGGKPEG